MAKKNNTIGYIIGSAVLAFGLFKLFGNRDTDNATEQNSSTDKPVPDTTEKPKPIVLDYSKILVKGSRGEEVKELQKKLGITADGIFGSQTELTLYNKTGLKQGSLSQIIKVMQDKQLQQTTQSRKNEIALKYRFGKKLIAAKPIAAKVYENRNGIWLSTDKYGNPLGTINIKQGADLGIVFGIYDYVAPWIIVELGSTFGYNQGKKIIVRGDMVFI